MNNTNNYRSNSVVAGVEDCEDQSSSPAVFVPSTTDTDLKSNTYKLIGQNKKKNRFPCEDIREKRKKTIEDLKDNKIVPAVNMEKGLPLTADKKEVINIYNKCINSC